MAAKKAQGTIGAGRKTASRATTAAASPTPAANTKRSTRKTRAKTQPAVVESREHSVNVNNHEQNQDDDNIDSEIEVITSTAVRGPPRRTNTSAANTSANTTAGSNQAGPSNTTTRRGHTTATNDMANNNGTANPAAEDDDDDDSKHRRTVDEDTWNNVMVAVRGLRQDVSALQKSVAGLNTGTGNLTGAIEEIRARLENTATDDPNPEADNIIAAVENANTVVDDTQAHSIRTHNYADFRYANISGGYWFHGSVPEGAHTTIHDGTHTQAHPADQPLDQPNGAQDGGPPPPDGGMGGNDAPMGANGATDGSNDNETNGNGEMEPDGDEGGSNGQGSGSTEEEEEEEEEAGMYGASEECTGKKMEGKHWYMGSRSPINVYDPKPVTAPRERKQPERYGTVPVSKRKSSSSESAPEDEARKRQKVDGDHDAATVDSAVEMAS